MTFTPYGQSGDQIEQLMLLSMWANFLGKQQSTHTQLSQKMLFAGLGRPTYPINRHTVSAYQCYWERMDSLAKHWHDNPMIGDDGCAIGYGDPYGDECAKEMMAHAMSAWYDSEVVAKNVLFTVGGIGGLRIIFDVLNSLYAKYGKYRIITPFPHYSAYTNNPHHLLHPIEVMTEPGYQLTADLLEKSIQKAYLLAENDGITPKAVLLCNPSNPLGTIIKEEELKKIVQVLRQYSDLHLIFDEAYAEMNFKEIPSFLKLAPDLKRRTIIMRSATKALSAAGERMAVLLAFDDFLMNELVRQQIVSYIHPPRSAQIAYAETMFHFNREDRKAMSSFYHTKVQYVIKRLKDMGAQMPCAHYEVDATFYALGDFSDLMGMEIPNGVEKALNKTGIVQTGEELAYSLLFNDSIMLAPLSFFGMPEDCGYLRITCSAKSDELQEMMDRLESRLFEARLLKNQFLVSEIRFEIDNLSDEHHPSKEKITQRLENIQLTKQNCYQLKEQNNQLRHLLNLLVDSSIANEIV
ncbi:pyridoxal phosphate-dependent aminotransferase [Legionella sp. 28fT52]|uniref:pyridoxal phosphate-dependent aminotransferase n=1 Tax=Legionella sp. 28fT52 TaxID=3410134 RepID=UPI003AF41289